MGCGINLWVEVRDETVWRFANPWRIESCDDEEWLEWQRPYERPNYFLFGILAGVRNQEFVHPISAPRGDPANLSDTGQRIILEWASDPLFALSWLGANELLTHNWETPIQLSGFVTAQERTLFDATGVPPKTWSRNRLDAQIVPLTWKTTERALCRDFVEEFLRTLTSYGPLELVRVCFFFDE